MSMPVVGSQMIETSSDGAVWELQCSRSKDLLGSKATASSTRPRMQVSGRMSGSIPPDWGEIRVVD